MNSPSKPQATNLTLLLPCGQHVKTLVVGDIARWKTLGRLRDELADCDFVDLSDLQADKILQLDPELILSPLVADGFDAFDVAERLLAVQFSGRYRVVTNDLPDAAIIRDEIRHIAPQLDFDLLVLPRLVPS